MADPRAANSVGPPQPARPGYAAITGAHSEHEQSPVPNVGHGGPTLQRAAVPATQGSTEPPIVELRGVSKSFGRQRVLNKIDLVVPTYQNTVIIGRSGTGKSVLLKHIVGLLRPDEGAVYVEGRRIDRLSERALVPIRQEISFVFQLNALFDSMTVAENVAFPMVENKTGRVNKRQIKELVARCLNLVGLSGFEHKRPAELSGGERKRAALARAIALEPPPKVILYDEPTAGLDPQRSDAINKLIRQMQEEFRVTGIVVTHDMKSAVEVGDRILMLSDGKFVFDGTAEEIQRCEDPVVRRFVRGIADESDIVTLL